MTTGYSRCCADEDIETARQVAKQLEIPFHVIDVHEKFELEIMDYFMDEYVSGRTPSPCAVCNRSIKFGILQKKAAELGADIIATGHYARINQSEDGLHCLWRGTDPVKDQSYFLSLLTQDQLSKALFPLGEMRKSDVERYAVEHDLASRESKESQEICFVTEGTHGTWIDVRSLNTPGKGDILDSSGNRVGTHQGIHHYTVGQRRGLGVAMGRPVYVVKINAKDNTVVVGDRSDTLSRNMVVHDVQWMTGETPAKGFTALTQIRYNHTAAESCVTPEGEGNAAVEFHEPQFAVTPGQLAVFYDHDRVLGAGWIG
jgi:tRNA-specific 2-thiouridylase